MYAQQTAPVTATLPLYEVVELEVEEITLLPLEA